MFTRALAAYGSRRDLVPLARLLYLSLGLDPETFETFTDPSWSEAVYYAVECRDYEFPGATAEERARNYQRLGDAIEATLPRLATVFYGDLPCAYWPVTGATERPARLQLAGIPTLVLGAAADPATPVGNGINVYRALADGYLVTQQGGPHVIFGRGNACPDSLVNNFLLRDRLPAQRETECPGALTDDHVPLTPRDARAFSDVGDALWSLEVELGWLPEYYYWDGSGTLGAGCGLGGTLAVTAGRDTDEFELDGCAFARRFTVSGTGEYDWERDRFEFEITTAGRWQCDLRYVRTDEGTRITGTCDGQPVELER
jgi:hypothetical protein